MTLRRTAVEYPRRGSKIRGVIDRPMVHSRLTDFALFCLEVAYFGFGHGGTDRQTCDSATFLAAAAAV